MKKEVIELEAIWYGGGFHFILQEDKTGLVLNNFGEDFEPTKVDENKIIIFWKKVEELGVWKWHKKYPYWQQKYEPLLDGCDWKLKLRDKDGRANIVLVMKVFQENLKT